MAEDNEDVQKVDEELTKDHKESGKHPETVSWNQYVGVKESLGKKIDTATQKVENLEGQLEKAVKPEEHEKIKGELEEAKTKLIEAETKKKEAEDKLQVNLDKSLSEKREILTKKGGISEEDAKTMSEEQIDGALKVLAKVRTVPGADMGGGGGAHSLSGSPMELARAAYTK